MQETHPKRNLSLNHVYAGVEREIQMGHYTLWGLSETVGFSEQGTMQQNHVVDAATAELQKKLGANEVPFEAVLTNPHKIFNVLSAEHSTSYENGELQLKPIDAVDVDYLQAKVGGIAATRDRGQGAKPVGTLPIFEADHPDSLVSTVVKMTGISAPEASDIQKNQMYMFGLLVIDPKLRRTDGSSEQLEGVYFVEHDWDQDLQPIER